MYCWALSSAATIVVMVVVGCACCTLGGGLAVVVSLMPLVVEVGVEVVLCFSCMPSVLCWLLELVVAGRGEEFVAKKLSNKFAFEGKILVWISN